MGVSSSGDSYSFASRVRVSWTDVVSAACVLDTRGAFCVAQRLTPRLSGAWVKSGMSCSSASSCSEDLYPFASHLIGAGTDMISAIWVLGTRGASGVAHGLAAWLAGTGLSCDSFLFAGTSCLLGLSCALGNLGLLLGSDSALLPSALGLLVASIGFLLGSPLCAPQPAPVSLPCPPSTGTCHHSPSPTSSSLS